MIELPDAGGDISSGVHQEEFGFERWTFILQAAAVRNMLEKGARMNDPDYIKELPGRFWMRDSRIPSRYEILTLNLKPLEDTRVRVEVVIRRGHWEIARFLRSHTGVVISNDEKIVLTCNCHAGHSWHLPKSSIPEFPK